MIRPIRLAIMASHAIPYQAPLFAALAKRKELVVEVFFGSDYGVRPQPSEWGGTTFTWDGDITSGYPHVFLDNWARRPHPSSFAGKINPWLIPTIARFRPDALLFSGYASLYHLQTLLAAPIARAKTLYFADSTRLPTSGLNGLLRRALLSSLYRHVDVILAVGQRNREHYRAYGVPDSKMVDFPFSVGNARFRGQAERLRPQRQALREAFAIPPDTTCVVFVGRLAREKNLQELIDATARVENMFLLVVGTGAEGKSLISYAERVLPRRHHFIGFLNQTRLCEAYVAADVMALPSSFEPWGLVLNEAMNAGLPIVVSDRVGAGPDLVTEGETGYIYPVGDRSALAHALAETDRMLRANRAAINEAVLHRIDRYSEEQQAVGVLRALGVNTD